MLDDDYIPSGSRERRLSRVKPIIRRRDKQAPTKTKQRETKSEFRRQIERVLNGDSSGSALGRSIGHVLRNCDSQQKRSAREMLLVLERESALLLSSPMATAGIVRLAKFHKHFRRSPQGFTPSGDTPEEQLRRLANLLLEEWAVPHWLNEVWLQNIEREQKWFVHLGSGQNLGTAPDLPYPLTRRMAHFAVNAPRGLRSLQALRWGQSRGMNIPEELCEELVNTRLSTELPDEPFWKTILTWFSVNPEIFGHASTIIDYIFAQRVGDFAPPLVAQWSITGRTPDRLLADARAWHAELNRRTRRARSTPPNWPSCGIAGFYPQADAGQSTPSSQANDRPRWWIMELLSIDQLETEGQRLHHCVASYAAMAAAGTSAIFSLRRRVEDREMSAVTIEIHPAAAQIVQARSLHNASPNAEDQRLIEHWAKATGLTIAASVFRALIARRRRG